MFFGIIWMSSQAVMPAVIGQAIDKGIADKDTGELLKWSGILFAIGLLIAGIVWLLFDVVVNRTAGLVGGGLCLALVVLLLAVLPAVIERAALRD